MTKQLILITDHNIVNLTPFVLFVTRYDVDLLAVEIRMVS
jgi:hypothetical protein